MIAAAKYLFN